MKQIFIIVVALLTGFAIGGYTFIGTQPRPLPGIKQCGAACLSDPELLGLLASISIHLAPGLLPGRVAESDKCVAISSPRLRSSFDFVFFPKRDIKNILELTEADESYVTSCFDLMRQLVEEQGLKNWQVLTNGPGAQEIDYLHFHLREGDFPRKQR